MKNQPLFAALANLIIAPDPQDPDLDLITVAPGKHPVKPAPDPKRPRPRVPAPMTGPSAPGN